MAMACLLLLIFHTLGVSCQLRKIKGPRGYQRYAWASACYACMVQDLNLTMRESTVTGGPSRLYLYILYAACGGGGGVGSVGWLALENNDHCLRNQANWSESVLAALTYSDTAQSQRPMVLDAFQRDCSTHLLGFRSFE